MNAVNPATALILGLFKKKADSLGPKLVKGHPYLIALEMAKVTHTDPDPANEEFVEMATNLLRKWAAITVGEMTTSCVNEIGVLGNLALKAGGKLKTASDELLTSMDFIHNIFKIFVKSIDYGHVAEWLFENGAAAAAVTENLDEMVMPSVIETTDDIDSPEKLLDFMKQHILKTLSEMPDMEPEIESSGQPAEEQPELKSEKKDKPPVTPQDIADLLFEKRVKPSAN